MRESFEDYRSGLLHRHENRPTSALSTVGDAVMVSGLAAGLMTRRPRVALVGLTSGLAFAAVAHLFQPGTLRDEVISVFRHPVWNLKAEAQRVFGLD